MTDLVDLDWPRTTIKKSSYLKGRIGWQGLKAAEFTDHGPYLITGTDFCDGKIEWSTCHHVTEERFLEGSYIHIRDGDLLITKDGTIGKVAHVIGCPAKAVLNSGIFLIRCSNQTYEHRFLYHLLNSHVFDRFLRTQLAGSTINHLYQNVFERFSFPIPDIHLQWRLADILDTFDRKIEQTQSLLDKYRKIKAGLMHDLFTRGATPDGHLRPTRAEAPGLYKQSPLGWLPKEWETQTLDRIAIRGSGHTPNKNRPEFWNGGIKWVSLADSWRLDRVFISETDKEISQRGIENSSAVIHPSGIVVLSRDAGVGKSAITTCNMAVSQHFMCWRCGPRLNNYYLYYWLQDRKREFENIATGSTIPTIGLRFFKHYRINVPHALEEQKRIGSILLSLDQSLFSLEDDVLKLKSVKRGLMHDLITGRVRVKVAKPEFA
jgi:type I restriction enzyme S subunit